MARSGIAPAAVENERGFSSLVSRFEKRAVTVVGFGAFVVFASSGIALADRLTRPPERMQIFGEDGKTVCDETGQPVTIALETVRPAPPADSSSIDPTGPPLPPEEVRLDPLNPSGLQPADTMYQGQRGPCDPSVP